MGYPAVFPEDWKFKEQERKHSDGKEEYGLEQLGFWLYQNR